MNERCRRQWKVERAASRQALERVLNALAAAGWEIDSVLAEHAETKAGLFIDYTVLAWRVMPATGGPTVEA